MRRGWIGFALLAVFLAAGLLVTWFMAEIHEPISQALDAAGEQALSGNWEKANALAGQAKTEWETYWSVSAAFADHGPMEEIDGLFAQAEVYRKQRDAIPFAAVCAELSRQIQAMGDAHALQWKNLL